MNVVVTPTNVELGEVVGIMQFVNEVWDEGERGCIFESDIIEMVIILYWVELLFVVYCICVCTMLQVSFPYLEIA